MIKKKGVFDVTVSTEIQNRKKKQLQKEWQLEKHLKNEMLIKKKASRAWNRF
ncbi:hypothetical protein [Solibacillus sp. NPDC093137]|uniref:hypothetical protein n=1 Tax=Solibacillus sp. NPDC093137 TaxID=3390678 RepID=UPI003D05566A